MKYAAFDVDCQKTFTPICPTELPVPKGHLIVQELNSQASLCQLRVGSKDAHHPKAIWVADEKHEVLSALEAKNVNCYWPAHAIVGTEGFELLDGLPQPIAYDYFIWKGVELDLHPYGACYHDLAGTKSTGVIEYLKCQNVDAVIVGGLALEYCVKETVLQLARAGFDVIVNLAATQGIDPEVIEQAMAAMREQGVRFVANSDELKQLVG